MKEKIFCELCEIELKKPTTMSKLLNIGMGVYSFKEGYYCERCAKIRLRKVEKEDI